MFTNLNDAFSFIQNSLPATRQKVSSADFVFFKNLLESSIGTDPNGVIYYRAYYAAARFLQLDPSSLERSKSIVDHYSKTIDSPEQQIQALLDLQNAEDAILQLTVDDANKTNVSKSGYEAGRQAWTETRNTETTDSVGSLDDIFLGYL